MNILAFSQSTTNNYRILEKTHKDCLEWADRFSIKFAPQKYELVHFTRRRKAFDLSACVRIGGNRVEPKADVRVLGVWLDTRLRWGAHVRQIQAKMVNQTRGLSAVAASTWGATFRHARQVYNSVVRPAVCFGATAWHSPSRTPEKP